MMANDPKRFGAWQPCHPREVAQIFSSATVPWWMAGGWAIDLFLGEQTRDHEDSDVLFLRPDQRAVRALLIGWDVEAVDPRCQSENWPFRGWESATPLDQEVHTLWCRPTSTAPWRLELMVEEVRETYWVFRRDARIYRPVSQIGLLTAEGIPFVAPEIQLLYKARAMRPKDETDFAHVLPALDRHRRHWLMQALALIHPHHPWLTQIEKRL